MIALPPDLSIVQTAPVRREWVTNTPYPKRMGKATPRYNFDEVFYQSARLHTSHPVDEIIKNGLFQKALDLIGRFERVLPSFQHLEPPILTDAVSKLATVLINEPFRQIVLEQTPEASLLVKAVYKGKSVYIDVDFDTDEPAGYEVVVSLYDGPTSLLSVSGSFDFAMSRLLSHRA